MNDPQKPRVEPAVLYLLLFFFLLQFSVSILTYDGNTLSFDESIWHYIGRNWFRHGLVPYTGGIDNKSPLVFAIYGLSDLLFGINCWFPRLLGAAVQSIGILFLYKTVKNLEGNKAGLVAISIYGLSLLWRSTGGKNVAFAESYEKSFILASVYYCTIAKKQKDNFLSGLLAGIGILFRLTGIFGALALIISLIRKNRLAALSFISGLTLIILVVSSAFSLSGIALHGVFLYGFADNLVAGSITDHSILWRLENLVNGLFNSEMVLFIPGLVAYLLIKRKLDLFVLWFLLELIGLNLIGLYARQHFRSLLPPLSIMTAVSVAYLVDVYKTPLRPLLIIIWITFFPKLVEPLVTLKNLFARRDQKEEKHCQDDDQKINDPDKRKLGLWIRSNSHENEKVFIAGFSAIVQLYSERLSPTIYFNVTQTKIAKERLVDDLESNKPELILIPRFADYKTQVDTVIRKYIENLVTRNYEYQNCIYSYGVYRLRK